MADMMKKLANRKSSTAAMFGKQIATGAGRVASAASATTQSRMSTPMSGTKSRIKMPQSGRSGSGNYKAGTMTTRENNYISSAKASKKRR